MGVAKVNNVNASTYGGFWNQDGTGAFLNGFHAESESKRSNLEATVSGPFAAFGRTHEFTAGVNGYRAESTSYTFSDALGNCNIAGVAPYAGCQYHARGLPIANWQTWDGSYANFNTFRPNARSETTTTSDGGYAAGVFSVSDPLTLILGTRISNDKTHVDSYSVANAVPPGAVSGNRRVVTPYAGLVYDINATYSAYASYTDVFNPQTGKDVNGNCLAPITGQSYEAGIKGEFLGGRLNASAAVFSAKQKNVAQRDGNNTTPDGAQAYVANGSGVKSSGFELHASGDLLPGWNVYAGYT